MDETTIIKTYNECINTVVSLVKDLNGQVLSLAGQVATILSIIIYIYLGLFFEVFLHSLLYI